MPSKDLKEKLLKKIKANRFEIIFIIIVISLGIFLRTFHFSSWLHFEIDQAFDFDLVSPAVSNGPQNLPLLGPNVGGGLLRLGPAFYYLEYASALVFGNTPTGHAMNVLILSILALPLFYVFCRKYFSKIEALGLLTIFATSLYCVMYARFSWSPNVLPFLILFSFFALLQAFTAKEKHPARWFLVSVAAITITSQIHFNSFFVAPLIAVTFTAIKRPHFAWKVWLAALGIIAVLYLPVVLNDVKNNKENYHYLKEKFAKTKPGNIFTIDSIIQTVQYSASEYFFINTGNDQINGTKLKGNGFDCKDCKENLGLKSLTIILFLIGLATLIVKLLKEKNDDRKNFLLLAGLWFLFSFYLIYSIADGYRMYPRFFLMISPLAIIFYGLLLEFLKPQQNKKGLVGFCAIILILAGLNLQRIIPVFQQLQNAPVSQDDDVETGDIFPNTNRLTLQQEIAIVDYIQAKAQINNYPVYLSVKSEYKPAFWALLEQRGLPYYSEINPKQLYAQGNYFDIRFAGSSSEIDQKFSLIENKNFGTLTVYFVQPLPQAVSSQRQADWQRGKTEEINIVSKLLTWEKLFK